VFVTYQQKSLARALNATEHVSCINEMTQKWKIKVTTKSVTETNVQSSSLFFKEWTDKQGSGSLQLCQETY
jgi:hypothetical protein